MSVYWVGFIPHDSSLLALSPGGAYTSLLEIGLFMLVLHSLDHPGAPCVD